ncbi:MAG TPA: ATP-binding protein [Bryobacteraceae bacterium]|jgi:SpoVK/Ycf46/Vps4 family AAA+-type ATPase|nr:ATP-binding protein [Bryobacteraceae bacterium]
MEPYRDSVEHLTDELKRVDLMIRRALAIARDRHAPGGDEFRGLVISEPEIESLLESGEFLLHHWRKQDAVKAQLEPFDQKLEETDKTILQRRDLTVKSGRRLALPYLAERFGLSAAEVDLLLIALAPELEPRYETLYAYLQDDVTRHRPSVNLALNLICRSDREKLVVRRFFAPGAPLLHFRMIELLDESHDREPTLLRKFMKIGDSLLRFLLDQPPTALALGSYVVPRLTIDALEVDDATRAKLTNLVDSLGRAGFSNTVVRVIAETRAEQESVAEALAQALHRPLIKVQAADLQSDPAKVNGLVRDAALLDAVVAILGADVSLAPAPDEQPSPAQAPTKFWPMLESAPGPILALGPAAAFPDLPPDARIWRVDIEAPDFDLRRQTWESALAGAPSDIDANRLADTFRFGGPQIRQTSTLAYSLAALRNPSNPTPAMEDMLQAGRSLSAPNLTRFATAIQPRYDWNDIVLPDEKKQQLQHIAARVRHRRTVHRDWGFADKLSRGKGLNVLFTGASGVGKTMAAEVLAKDLSLVLYQIDLSSVVSKYIGQTEKHLSAIFHEAEMSQNLLFFDEADSLFGKRTEVKDAHDRYANLEVNYLLQRIEQYEGLVVLSTNLQRNLDDAFLRRMQDVVDFPMPDETQREQIWRRHIPQSAPLESDIDFAFLARQFKLTGGVIKNAVMTAAFLAAGKSKKIGMAEMIRAVRIELQKQGRLVMKSDFGKYFDTARTPAEKEVM